MEAREWKYRAWIGLGSNLPSVAGGRHETLRSAVRQLDAFGMVRRMSSAWETAPVGVTEQPTFLNAAVELNTQLDPDELLRNLLTVEREHGRIRYAGIRNGPRTLDLDLLLAEFRGNAVLVKDEGLLLPHPEMHRRRFVLVPLAEIAPRLQHPVLGKCIQELLEDLECSGKNGQEDVRRLGPLLG